MEYVSKTCKGVNFKVLIKIRHTDPSTMYHITCFDIIIQLKNDYSPILLLHMFQSRVTIIMCVAVVEAHYCITVINHADQQYFIWNSSLKFYFLSICTVNYLCLRLINCHTPEDMGRVQF